MSTQSNRRITSRSAASPQTAEPLPGDVLPPETARRAEEEALHRAFETSEETIESRRRGRIEAEAHRVSEEVTHEAQARLRATQAHSAGMAAPSVSGIRPPRRASDSTQPAPVARSLPLPAARPIHRVLVPLDGSPHSERVLPYLRAIASMTGAAITLLHVTPIDGAASPRETLAHAVGHTFPNPPATPVHDPTGYLLAVEAELAQQSVTVDSMTVAAPSPFSGIDTAIKQILPDLVVLATHARQGMERRFLGSVADRLVRETDVPLLVIPPRAEAPETPPQAFSRVLVPLDGSVEAEQALAPVRGIAQQRSEHQPLPLRIVLLCIAEDRVACRESTHYVEDVQGRLIEAGLPVSVEIMSASVVGSPAGAIVGAAAHGVINLPDYPAPFDLVAMATHGRGGFERWLYGSVASYVLPRSKVPILLVHERHPKD